MRGDLLYRCRRCGEEFAACNVGDLDWMLVQLAMEAPMPEDWRTAWPDVHTIHCCTNGGRGMADLIGGRATPSPGCEPRETLDG